MKAPSQSRLKLRIVVGQLWTRYQLCDDALKIGVNRLDGSFGLFGKHTHQVFNIACGILPPIAVAAQ